MKDKVEWCLKKALKEMDEKGRHRAYEKQDFEGEKEMFSIKTINSEGKEGELVVSEEHKVYVSKNSLSSLVLKTFTTPVTDNSWKCWSSDQIGQCSLSANARYGASSGSDINDFAQFNCCGETLTFKLINLDNISFILLNLSSEIFSNSQTSLECSSNSFNMNLCEYNSKEYSFTKLLVNESFFNKEKATLASVTNFIYSSPDFANLSLTDLANFKQSSSVILLSLVNSSSSLNSLALSSCTMTSCFASSDQFTQENSFISDLSLSGTEKVTDAIYSLPPSNFFNCSNLEAIILLNISDHLISGCLSILDLNSSDRDNVTVAMFTPINYVNEHKYVNIYKSFGFDGIKYHLTNLKKQRVLRRVGGKKGGHWEIQK